jgi:hypothetical protein
MDARLLRQGPRLLLRLGRLDVARLGTDCLARRIAARALVTQSVVIASSVEIAPRHSLFRARLSFSHSAFLS